MYKNIGTFDFFLYGREELSWGFAIGFENMYLKYSTDFIQRFDHGRGSVDYLFEFPKDLNDFNKYIRKYSK